MSAVETSLQVGQRVIHPEFGEGVVVDLSQDGYVRAFFPQGERQVPVGSLRFLISRNERILRNVEGSPERLRKLRLVTESYSLPLMESAAALTAAKVDLLPHQVVLTHRIATASPRRFLVADEVGLGKTIETALILRELASRGELRRALMVVPAGLVNNWHRELNEVFNLNFEVFGSEGDVTDRRSNAFAKHDRLIASIDTLKRPARIKRLLEAPAWDLVVFDEAHHLTAHLSGSKVRKTENYKLAEALKGHSRDLLLLSATPHQGEHFRFWMLIQLLNPALFKNAKDMVENRHRLNSVIYRRTKADACRADGSSLFARRWVHTESFVMSADERQFYSRLRDYLEDGFALAKNQGSKGQALGFVMAIFQKIAASSFAAVRRTLRRRLLMLTIHEAIMRERELDVEGRLALNEEAKDIVREEYGLGDDAIGRGQVDRVMADLKVKVLKRLDESELELIADPHTTEAVTDKAEDFAASVVSMALPEERSRIRLLLTCFPTQRETKVEKLLGALGALWRQNQNEKVVIFATYLGTVELLGREIEATYPGQGVVVLRGGDHGAKLASEKKFKQADGPRVLVCTAAGREGINLQFARVLFNFDLPWNPMDVEQRIGRIHRYGQNHTAQVYNLVLSDTIEGRIFLLLDDKLKEIGKALGKVDESGNVTEDLRSQILGQLSERISYDKLYQQALSDPELRRTRIEVEAALANASEARKVVFELFQDLDGFSLEDYKPFADVAAGMERLVNFVRDAVDQGQRLRQLDEHTFALETDSATIARFTTDRDAAQAQEGVELLGVDHPLVQRLLHKWQSVSPEDLGAAVQNGKETSFVLTWWYVQVHGAQNEVRSYVVPIGIDHGGTRLSSLEEKPDTALRLPPTQPALDLNQRLSLLQTHLEPMLNREVAYRGLATDKGGLSTTLVGWVESN
ncbi:MAG: helicase [Blastocatellia bacterium AA13]|nr:MAG: helicase [Blastocatellia bacterium AA13]